MLTLLDPLEHARGTHPERIAIIDGEIRMDYAELHRRCLGLAAGLHGLGARRGDRIAVLAANGHRYVEALFGIPAYGMVIVPLNTRLAQPELEAILDDCGAQILLTDRDPGSLAKRVDHVVLIPDDYEELLSAHTRLPPVEKDENAVAALFYTGGTTGIPKGVMLTHRNLIANAFHKAVACSLSSDDRFLAAPAMFHVAGVAPLASLVWLGGAIVTVPSFDPVTCLEMIETRSVTVFMPVPTMLAAFVEAQQRAPRDVGSLRLLGHAGAPIASELIEEAHATFPLAEIAQFYGATETSSIVTCFRHEELAIGTARLGSCGKAVMGVAVKIAGADGMELGAGRVGEILVRGPNVTVGYWQNPAATESALRDGWYHTGDLGSLRDGYLFVVDRLKDMIVSGGENVYSVEVEEVLYRHPAVVEAAVFGIPDSIWGEAVHAVVVVGEMHREGADGLAAELSAHCRQFIAGYKVPKKIDIRSEPLPKSGPGKIVKRLLREPYWCPSEKIA